MTKRNGVATSAMTSASIRSTGHFGMRATVSGLGVAAYLCLLASAGSAQVRVGDAPAAESPAACSKVDYGAPTSISAREAAGGTITDPPNPDGPTTVGVGFFVNDIRGIDPVRDEFQFRGYVRVLWCDPRLAFEPEIEGQSELVFTGEGAEKQSKQMWLASGYPVNKVGELEFSERVLRIRRDGTIEQSINVSVPLATHFDLRRFPIDRQILELQVESYLWNRDQLQFVHD
jgi:hypothetical protein